MLLTLKPTLQSGLRSPHVYSPPRSEPIKLFSPSESHSDSLPPLSDTRQRRMSTPHRGLPPLGGIALPNPNPNIDRGPPPPPPSLSSQTQPMGQLPAPPTSSWQGTEEAMRNWLAAKAEEDKRKQEEEKTRQESLRLEQRKIEQSMLRESLQGGVPPHMVPMVFAGMGGANLANSSLEWAQNYFSQLSLQQQPQQPQHAQLPQQQQSLPPPQSSPDVRRDRGIAGPQPNPYASHQPPAQSSAPNTYGFDRLRSTQQAIQAAPGPTSAPRPPPSGLTRLNTGDMTIQQPPQHGAQLPIQQSSQPSQQHEAQQSTPTSIYFHHWVPPNSQKEAGSPSDFSHSPKKRKTNTGHGKTPETSPSFSQLASASRRNRAQSIQKSEASSSSRGAHEGHQGSRPQSRQRQHSMSSVAESGTAGPRRGSSQPETSRKDSVVSENGGRKRTGSGTPKREAEGPL